MENAGRGKTKKAALPDVLVENHGSLFLFRPLNKEAEAWIEEHVGDDRLSFGGALVVEPRYAADLYRGMAESGLSIR